MPQTNTKEITEVKYLRHLIPEIREFLLSRNKKPDLEITTIPDLNEKIWGIPRKAMTVIGARTSQGKSALATQVAFDLADQGHTVLFLSLEMTVEKIGARLFCYQQRFDNIRAFRGAVADDIGKLDSFEHGVKNVPLIINDMLGKTWQDIDELLSTTDLKPDVVIVDYIQSIANKGKNQLENINEYIRHFREMAIRKNFAGIICSQINRTVHEDKTVEPQPHQLKSSGFIEEHADLILLLHWPHKYAEKKDISHYKVFIAKNRDGSTGYVDLKFEPQFYAFSNADPAFIKEVEVERYKD